MLHRTSEQSRSKVSGNVTFNSAHPLLLGNTSLSDTEQKFCSCVVKVAAAQPGACNLEKAWFEQRDSKTCANPYAVCAHSVGTSTRKCNESYNYSQFTDQQLIALANLNNVTISSDRATIISLLQK